MFSASKTPSYSSTVIMTDNTKEGLQMTAGRLDLGKQEQLFSDSEKYQGIPKQWSQKVFVHCA